MRIAPAFFLPLPLFRHTVRLFLHYNTTHLQEIRMKDELVLTLTEAAGPKWSLLGDRMVLIIISSKSAFLTCAA
jgi:hypothetical protein